MDNESSPQFEPMQPQPDNGEDDNPLEKIAKPDIFTPLESGENTKKNKKKTAPQPSNQEPLTPVRTFYTDIAETRGGLDDGLISDVLQRDRQVKLSKKEKADRRKKNIRFGILSGIFVILGAAALVFVLQVTRPTLVVGPQTPFSIVRAEDHIGLSLEIDSQILATAIITESEKEVNSDMINQIFFTTEQGFRGGFKRTLTALGEALPPLLLESVNEEFMYGVYGSGNDGNIPFLILNTGDFDSIQTALRQWENTMIDSIDAFITVDPELELEDGFRSEVLQNKSARVLYGQRLVERQRITQVPIIYDDSEKETVNETVDEEFTPTGETSEESQPTTESVSNPTEQAENAPQENNETEQFEERPAFREVVETYTELSEPEIALYYAFLDENNILISTHPRVMTPIIARKNTQQIFSIPFQ